MNNQALQVPGVTKEELRAILIIFGAIIAGAVIFDLTVIEINYI